MCFLFTDLHLEHIFNVIWFIKKEMYYFTNLKNSIILKLKNNSSLPNFFLSLDSTFWKEPHSNLLVIDPASYLIFLSDAIAIYWFFYFEHCLVSFMKDDHWVFILLSLSVSHFPHLQYSYIIIFKVLFSIYIIVTM